MNPIFDFLIEPYNQYPTKDIVLEVIAILLGLLSVWFAKKNTIWVYPTGMVSTGIYVYILLKAGLIGDFLINAYYFTMSIYGWYFWTQKKEGKTAHPIQKISKKEKYWSLFLFSITIAFVAFIYVLFDKWNGHQIQDFECLFLLS